jgi:S-adenosylmethionine hydrolase
MERIYDIEPVIDGKSVKGSVLWVDRFGTLVTNIEADLLLANYGQLELLEVMAADRVIGEIHNTFSDVESGENVAYIGSGGHLEIAVRDDSAFDLIFPDMPDMIEITVRPVDEESMRARSNRLH